MDTILVVDDEPKIADLIAMLLDEEGLEVLTAYDGQEALAIAREERPRLVLTDIMMPRMDGVELCRRLQGGPETRDIVVLLMSAARRGDPHEYGAAGLIRKPFELDDLIATVRRHLIRPLPPA